MKLVEQIYTDQSIKISIKKYDRQTPYNLFLNYSFFKEIQRMDDQTVYVQKLIDKKYFTDMCKKKNVF
jgi:hypothetical protein